MQIDEMRSWPAGLINAGLFFGVAALGIVYIVVAKTLGFYAFWVTLIPVLVMLGYAALLLGGRLVRLRDDQSGDNLYYLGFLFTLTSLAVSLYQFSGQGSAIVIVQNFGVAIASTITGIALRIFFNQMRRDPVEVEQVARLELAEASRRVRGELDSAVLEFAHFRRTTQQSLADAIDQLGAEVTEARGRIVAELETFAKASRIPLEEASVRLGDVLAEAAGRLNKTIDPATQQIAGAGRELTGALGSVRERLTGELDEFAAAYNKHPINSTIEGLVQSVDKLVETTETQSACVNDNIAQLRAFSGSVALLASEVPARESVNKLALGAERQGKYMDEAVAQLKALSDALTVLGRTMPAVQSISNLTQGVEVQAKTLDDNILQLKELSLAIASLAQEMPTARIVKKLADGAERQTQDIRVNIAMLEELSATVGSLAREVNGAQVRGASSGRNGFRWLWGWHPGRSDG